MSEIDDIFATKGKIDSPAHPPPSKKKKKDKKKIQGVTPVPVEETSHSRPVPETIADPSAVPHIPKRRRKDSEPIIPSKRKKATKEEEFFKDSRGTGPRKTYPHLQQKGRKTLTNRLGRKTEEGWDVYKADELGLNDEGGGKQTRFKSNVTGLDLDSIGSDTPLCPFDCECCEWSYPYTGHY
jgi:hypothetical protein